MSSIPPPHSGRPEPPPGPEAPEQPEKPAATSIAPLGKRPRYLVLALIGALVFGAGCWTEGCNRLAFYRGERDHTATLNASIRDDADRAHAEGLYQRFLEVADTARGRAIPMAAATFVLGAALLALAARGLAGRSNTRSALMQVVAAQAVIVVVSYFAIKDIRNAELDWEFERSLIHQHESLPAEQYQEVVPTVRAMRRWAPPGWLVFRSLASALILFALSRPKARAFFEAAARPVPDP